MSARTRIVAGVLGAVIASGVACAHDCWLRPKQWRCEPGAAVGVDVLVGEDLKGESRPFAGARMLELSMSGPGGRPAATASKEGEAPAGRFVAGEAGLHVVVYRTRETKIELEAAKFESYLREEGLEGVIEERGRRGEREAAGREAYSRCAKSFVVVGERTAGAFGKVAGGLFELVPESNPAEQKAGGELRVKALLRGRALAGAQVMARAEASPGQPVVARTDGEGVARLRLGAAGGWVVTSVAMVRAEGRQDVDWESGWASLSFEVAAEAAPTQKGIPASVDGPSARP